jgi:D-aminopeptidase
VNTDDARPPAVREHGVRLGRLPSGNLDAITDVDGVLVGMTTLVDGSEVRTGVTVVQPHGDNVYADPVFAGCHRLNGNGEMTGLEWVRECGFLTTPIAITNTADVGTVRDAVAAWQVARGHVRADDWTLPVVGETFDGVLSDLTGRHVREEHVVAALDGARGGAVPEGNVGGGTGMICHEFKGGTGTASRVVAPAAGGWTVGVLVQANYGRRSRLRVDGVPVGEGIGLDVVPGPHPQSATAAGGGSIIVVVATDAPLLPPQLDRLAQRAALGIGRMGGAGEHTSGDLVLSFSTANRRMAAGHESGVGALTYDVKVLSHSWLTPLFDAVIEATEAAILNALLAARTMTGRGGVTAHALPHDLLAALTAP